MILASIRQLKTERSIHNESVAGNDPKHEAKLTQVLQKLNDYKSGRGAQQNEPDLVSSLENELVDIINIFQNQHVGQSQEIEKLSQEVKRLNTMVAKKSQVQVPSSVSAQQAKINGIEELLRKTYRECCDSRNQVLKLQSIIREKDKIISDLRSQKCEINNDESLQLENERLKEIIKQKDTELKQKDAHCGQSNNYLIEKIQNLETSMIRGQNEYQKKTYEYMSHVQKLEHQIKLMRNDDEKSYLGQEPNKVGQEITQLKTILKDMEQKYNDQAGCTKSLQDSIFICELI
jgi:hypothetical protein